MRNLSKILFKESIKYICLMTFMLGLSYTSWSQSDLATNAPTSVQIDNCCDGDYNWMSRGEVQDFRIPDDVIYNGFNAITFSMSGGDGGYARAGSNCKSVGGSGASASITCRLGDEINYLKPGGKIRFIVGKQGEDSSSGPSTATGGGGGGGTAVLYRETNSDDWIILAVAGGGGGGHQGNLLGACVDSQKGQGGRISSSGGKGGGDDGGAGGTDGGKGSKGDGGAFIDGGAGGGAYGGGPGGSDKDGQQGYPNGGNGGDNSGDNSTGNFGIGGWGFGGGGSSGGGTAGAGGGGYSGGGSGEVSDNGGGGGSYINYFYAYDSYLVQGHSDGNSHNGSVTYQFEDVCAPVITTVEEIQGFCDDENPSAYIDVDISGDLGCDQTIYYKLYGPGTVKISTTGIVEVPYPGTFSLHLELNQPDNPIPILLDSRSLTFYDEDVIAPVVDCLPTYSIDLVTTPQLTNLIDDIDLGSYDNCGITSISASKTSFDCNDVGTQDVVITFADEAGNTTECIVEVTVEESEAPIPVISNLPTINNVCFALVEPPTATDLCGGLMEAQTNDPTMFNAPGTYTINWYFIDPAGNSTTQQQTVIITDDSAPTAICPTDIIVDLAPGECSTTVDYAGTSSDNCDDLLAVNYTGNSNIVPAGSDRLLLVQIRYSSGSWISSITYDGKPMTRVIREIQPWNPARRLDLWYILLGTGDEINATAQITGGGGGGISSSRNVQYITFENVDQDNPLGGSDSRSRVNEDLEVFARSNDIIYEGASRSHHSEIDPLSGQTQIFSHLPTGIAARHRNWGGYIAGTGSTQTLAISSPNFALHIAVAIQARHFTSYDYNIDPGSTFQVGTTPVIFTVTDNANQSNACAFNVIVRDGADPTISCPENITLDANLDNAGGCTASTTFNVTTTDDCTTPTLSQTEGLTSGADFPIGTTTNTFVSTDGGGRTATCSFTVSVNDIQAPEALCQNKTIQLDANGNAAITATEIDNGSNDNCGNIASLSLDITSFNCDDVGTHTVTLTAKDDYDNANTCQATITVQDNIAPTAVCQTATVQLDANGQGSLTAADIGGNSTDVCGISSLSISKTSFDCSDEGTRNIQLTVTDNNGNSSTCNAAVSIQDNIAPVALCQNKTVQLDANGAGSITTTDINNNSTDACGIESLELDNTNYNCEDVGTHTVTLTVEDEYSNESTCQSTVTVEDNIAPVALCQNKTIQLDANGAASISAGEIDNNSNDACGISTLSLDKTSFDCNDVGTNTIVLTVKDVNNNTSTCQSTVTVEDNVAPVALCQDKTVQLGANGAGSITTSDIDNGSNDACGIASLSLDNTSFSCHEVGNLNMVTLTLTDNNGNSSTCQASITVEDNIAPTALCHDVIVSLDSEGNGTLSASEVNNSSYDNCGIASMSISQSQFSCNDIGVKNVTLTVIDIHGHLSSCLANIDTEVSGDLVSDWTSNDIGQVTVGNDYWYDPCEYPPLHYVTGSGNNATSTMTDNVAFMAHNTCGDFTFTAKIESVDPNGYGGLMVREGMEDGAKQVALFSNLSNTLRHEVRYNANTPKQIGSFFKPNPIWLRIQRQGDWIFSYSSYDGTNFQYVHGVFIQMDNCLEVGMASFTYMPNAQTEVVFSNVSISGSNGGFSANDDGLANTEKPQHLNTATPKYHNTETPKYHNTETPYNGITLFPNPNQGQFFIQLDRPIEENTTVYIYNQYGQQVHSEQLQQGATQLQLYLEQLASGTYWLKMNGTSHTIATKVFTVTND
ncbi:MAG: HYR domain-containing protein [Chitinophagales bacterium]|nr:HYR domain-containing protein [Chitinophagales bacterium]